MRRRVWIRFGVFLVCLNALAAVRSPKKINGRAPDNDLVLTDDEVSGH